MNEEPKLPIRKDKLAIKLLIRKSKDIRLTPRIPFEKRIEIGKMLLDRMDVVISRYDAVDVKPDEVYSLISEKDDMYAMVGGLERAAKEKRLA